MIFKRHTLSAALITLAASPAYADKPPLEETVVVSSRTEMPIREVATSVAIVTAEDLEIRGFDGLANALRYDTGISVTNNGGIGKATSLSIRGERGFRTKVYIDGIETTDPSTPQSGPNFAHIMSAGIERVEILRGPQGMMYGADAGGVVSITTIKPTEGLTGGISGEYGRYETTDFKGHLAGGNDKVDFALNAAQFDTDGFSARTDDTSDDDDGYENTTLHARGGWNISDTLRLEGVIRDVDGDNQFDDCFANGERSDDCEGDYEQRAYRVALIHNTEQFGNTLSYNVNETDRRNFAAGIESFKAEGDLEDLNYLGNYKHSDNLQFVYGAELRKESIDSSGDDESRDQRGYYGEYIGNFDDSLFLTAGLRYDDNDDFGSETTYRLSAAYLIDTGDGELKLKSTYGTGFRAPSLFEIAYNAGPNAFPPASETTLSAEKSEGYDIGFVYYGNSGWLFEVTYFDQTIEDEIFFDNVDFSGYLQGDGDSTSEGVELLGELPIGELWRFTANYTYNDTNDADGEQRRRAPKHLANAGIEVTPLDGRLVLALHGRLSRDVPGESNGDIDDYEVVDFSASYEIMDGLQVFGRIENLLDEDYEEIPQYNTAGRSGYAG
ncbi:MAG: TonB-dependent receptor, partial [Pseudomonadota bacterium]